MLRIRWSNNRLIFNIEIPIPGKDGIYIETGLSFPLPCSGISTYQLTNLTTGISIKHLYMWILLGSVNLQLSCNDILHKFDNHAIIDAHSFVVISLLNLENYPSVPKCLNMKAIR